MLTARKRIDAPRVARFSPAIAAVVTLRYDEIEVARARGETPDEEDLTALAIDLVKLVRVTAGSPVMFLPTAATSHLDSIKLHTKAHTIIVECANLPDGSVEYVAVVAEMGHQVHKSLARAIRRAWGISG